uniref:Putative ubiquitin conjugation factor E4 B n=1 Tax=Trypanosoma vivax (strain Y486) TaxID=1055687 RepID=G0TWR6_TRYVY|nr:putative ubiquitin conjugation factor E4 B, fragment [Trypanosoma vivax Y486]
MLEINGLQQLHSLIEREPVVVVEFYTDWCGACQIVRNQYEAMSNIYSSVMFGKCNIERSRDLAQALSIESIPTFVVWLSGEVHKTIRGADVDTLRATVEGAMRNVQGGALPESRKSRINSSGAELAQRMEALARAINSASADKAAEQVACDAICAMIEKDSKSQPFGVVLLPYFASTGFDARAIDALFTYIKSREHPQCRECEFIVNGLVTYLIECFLSVTLNDTKELDVLRRALYSMVCCSSILPILVSSHLFYSDSITDGLQLEYNTLLGALLGVSIHDRSARAVPPFLEIFQQKVLMETFPNGTDDHSIKIFELQLCMESCCAANKSIILALLHSKVSRFPTLRFLGTALRLNASYSKTMRRNLPLSSQFFMVQMNDVLVEAALPVFSCFDPQSIPAVYVLNDPSPVREEFQMDGTILERFSHMVIADVNDSVDQLTETLLKMNQLMSSGADLSENASPSRPGNGGVSVGAPLQSNGGSAVSRAYAQERGRSQSEEDEDNGEYSTDSSMTYHRMGLDLKERIHLFEASIDLFIQLAESFSKGVAQNMVAQQIGQMLARSLTCFVGTESKRLKIEHPERYNFRPREILGRLVRCLVQFRRFHNFLRCLCNCGVPLNDILKAMRTVVDRGLVSESLTWKLNEIASALEAVSAEINEDEALWDEAPEYALDALLSTPLLNPLALPADVKDLNDLVYANEETIHHLLLSECKHPFTKKYLDEKMVREFNEREDVSRARQQLQDRIAQWLNDAKKKRQPN